MFSQLLKIYIVLFVLFPLHAYSAMNEPELEVFVSVLPQKYFVEKIAGHLANVNVMVGPGQSPATFEPTTKKMAQLAQAQIYFRIGTPFESVWMRRLQSSNPQLKIIDVSEGIALRAIDNSKLLTKPNQSHEHGHNTSDDPHIWTDPQLVKKISNNIMLALIEIDPENTAYYRNNFKRFARELDELDREIQHTLQRCSTRKFMVFHPSWGYFADRYGLTQIPIESEGKTPAAKTLSKLVDFARKNDIRAIIVQKQIRSRDADTIANEIGASVVIVDPLAEDYLNNLKSVAHAFVEAMS